MLKYVRLGNTTEPIPDDPQNSWSVCQKLSNSP